MSVNWDEHVNTRFYNMQTTSVENIETLEFESGKTRTFLKNSSPKKAFSLSFDLRNYTEEVYFWNWYENKLLSRTQSFYLSNLLGSSDAKAYIMTSEPSVVSTQYPKEVQINLQEE